jgi:RNA polymerase sigma factor (sigma-70 family)
MGVTPERLAELLEAHAAALELFASQWSLAPADVVQEAFVELARQPDEPQSPVGWLYRVVRNRAASEARSARRRKRRESIVAAANDAWFQASARGDLGAEEATEALRGLPEDLREVLVSRIWGELTFEEIGEITNTSASTAFRRYEEALSLLRNRLRVPCQNHKTFPPT